MPRNFLRRSLKRLRRIMLKCARYRLVNDTPKFCFFSDSIPSIFSKSFLDIGVPPYLMDYSKKKKMEDNLPRELFCFKYLYSSRNLNRIDLYFALFPFVMLQEGIFNDNLTNEERFECLEKGIHTHTQRYVSLRYALRSLPR